MTDEGLLELFRPEAARLDRELEIRWAGVEPCSHGWLPTDPDSTCVCWDRGTK